MPQLGWEPVVLTVHEKYYEEKTDEELLTFIPEGQRIEKVNAFGVTRPRLIGDVGLRGFFQLLKKASQIVRQEKIDFIHIFIPSFYLALIGKIIFIRFGIRYGIDYIDPWVHVFPGSENVFSRHWFSTKVARILEPWSVSDASLLSGVSSAYFTPVLRRNPHLEGKVKTFAMPYGWDKTEAEMLNRLNKSAYLFHREAKIKLVYAGAYLPKSEQLLKSLFKVIAAHPDLFSNICFYFIGTGKANSASIQSSIADLAVQYGVSNHVIEHPERLSYVDVLVHVRESDGLFILGSTESHYTPSKFFNAILMKKPVFALLHKDSSINGVIRSSDWGSVVEWEEELTPELFCKNIQTQFQEWKIKTLNSRWSFKEEQVNPLAVDQLLKPLADLLSTVQQ